MDEREAGLRARLEDAYRRLADATPGSPEWDAAKSGTDALEAQLAALHDPPSLTAHHVMTRLGPILLEDGATVQGSIMTGDPAEALRFDISAIPDHVRTRHEFKGQLEAVVRAVGFVVETEVDEVGLSFYVWDPTDRATRPD